jgi:large-conductance mechanosensitive channel
MNRLKESGEFVTNCKALDLAINVIADHAFGSTIFSLSGVLHAPRTGK